MQLVQDDTIKKYMLSRQYQVDIHNESLFSRSSNYFTRKQFPISEEIEEEMDKCIMNETKVLPGRQVFAIRRFVLRNVFDESQMISPICSPKRTVEEVEQELLETNNDIDREFQELEEQVERARAIRIVFKECNIVTVNCSPSPSKSAEQSEDDRPLKCFTRKRKIENVVTIGSVDDDGSSKTRQKHKRKRKEQIFDDDSSMTSSDSEFRMSEDKASQSQEQTEDEETEKMQFEETYDRELDWYISNLPKSTVLAILYIIKDLLAANPLKEPTKAEFYSSKADISKRCEKFVKGLNDLSWERIRGVTKSMFRKHKGNFQKSNLQKYNNFKDLAISYYELCTSDNV